MIDNLAPLRWKSTSSDRLRWRTGAVVMATAGVLLAGCAATAAAPGVAAPPPSAGGSAAASQQGDQFVPSPDVPFPCSLIATEEIGFFIDNPTLDEVLRADTNAIAEGCVWKSGDGNEAVAFTTDVSDRTLARVLESGIPVPDLGSTAAYFEEDIEIDDDTAGVERTLISANEETRVRLTVRSVDPAVDSMVLLLGVVQARLAAAASPVDQNGEAQLGVDLLLCQDIIASWDRSYAVLEGTASIVSSVGKYTTGLVEYATEKGPSLTNPDLKAAFEKLAAAGSADPGDPTTAEVEQVRLAVVEIGEVCAAGGVPIDWLPN